MNVLLGVTGSVAAKLTPKLEMALVDSGHQVQTVLTQSALRFTQSTQTNYDDEDEWEYYEDKNRVLHIDLVQWADVLVVAPCTANTLSKLSVGICDNLLTCCVRAWPLEKPLHIAPAMNCEMWKHLTTFTSLRTLKNCGYWIHDPIEKKLFCGDYGMGAMASIDDIVKGIKNTIN